MNDPVTPSERARTILASSTSAHVSGADAAGARGRVVLLCDPAPPGASTLPVEVELADAAPLATRERIRARLRIIGRAATAPGCDALHVHPDEITLALDGSPVAIDVDDLLAAVPDPLHEVEASVLGHLEASHGDVVVTLTRLVDARHLQGVVRVWPYRLDRYGVVLRLEYATGHADARLPFRVPITAPDQLSRELTALIARARAHVMPCARPRILGPLAPILRSAPAAQRLCSPDHDASS